MARRRVLWISGMKNRSDERKEEQTNEGTKERKKKQKLNTKQPKRIT
jgi:hypothetical protein